MKDDASTKSFFGRPQMLEFMQLYQRILDFKAETKIDDGNMEYFSQLTRIFFIKHLKLPITAFGLKQPLM